MDWLTNIKRILEDERVLLLDSVNYVKQEDMSISSSLLTSQLNDVNSVLQGGHGGKRSLGMLLMMTYLLNAAI